MIGPPSTSGPRGRSGIVGGDDVEVVVGFINGLGTGVGAGEGLGVDLKENFWKNPS